MKLAVYNLKNKKVGELEVAPEVFEAAVKPHLHHTVVRAQRAARRRGTASTKRRSEVKGSTAKVYRQKGTGNARHGNRKAPQYVGGGVAFGPKPRSFALKVTKKVRRAALRSALSAKVQQGRLKVLESFDLAQIRTKAALAALQGLEAQRALVVDQAENRNLKLSVRNLKDYKYLAHEGLNIADVLRFDHLLVTRSALEKIQGVLMP